MARHASTGPATLSTHLPPGPRSLTAFAPVWLNLLDFHVSLPPVSTASLHGFLVTDSPAEDATLPSLTVSGGPFDGQRLVVAAGGARSLGSGAGADLRVELGNVEASHAQVVWDARGLLLSDVGTTTGTYVNGEKVAADHLLQDGDRVFLGPPGSKQTAKLAVHIPEAAVVSEPVFAEEPLILDEATPMVEPMPQEEPAAAPAPTPAAAPAPPIVPAASPLSPAPAAAPAPKVATAAPRKPDYNSDMPSIASDRPREAPSLPPAPPAAPVAKARRAARKKTAPVPRAAIIGVAAAALAGGAFFAYQSLHAPPPVLASIVPPKAEAGQTVTVSGSGFGADPARLVVRFGPAAGTILSATETQIAVTIPEAVAATTTDVSVSVEARGARSNALFFKVSASPKVTSLTPDVGMPGDEIVAKGKGLAGKSTAVLVSGQTAEMLETQPTSIRFKVPDIPVTAGQAAAVVVQVGTESSRAVSLLLGRLPLVLEVAPLRAAAGERVTVKGRGFDPTPAGNAVSFAGQPSLVFSASETELSVSVPSIQSASTQTEAPVVVQAKGRTSNPGAFALLRVSPGYFAPRYFPAPVAEHAGRDYAFISTDLGPSLLLGGRGDAPSTAERASRVATALNAMVDAAANRPVAVEFREKPELGVGIAGSSNLLVKALPEDAAAYDEGWDPAAKGRRTFPRAVAIFWTAILQDEITLFLRHERPVHVLELSPRGKAFLEIYAEGLRRAGPGVGVPIGVVSPLGASLAKSLKDMALIIPAESQAVSAAGVEGRWEGTMEESGAGQKAIQVKFRLEGKQLAGALTTRSGGLGVELPLREIVYEKGTLRFVLLVGGSPRHFSGTVAGDTVTGTIQLGANTKDSVGRFSLKYVE